MEPRMVEPAPFFANACTRQALLLLLVLVAGCRRVPTEKEMQGAQIHYDLGVSLQQQGDVQTAYKEFELALKLDPDFAEVHNALGVLLHLAFKRPDEAVAHYKRSLELRPGFSDARTNLANVYLDQGRYDDAIALYEAALNDMLYSTPYIAQGNLGWALYKKGDSKRAVEMIKGAITTNPKFCLGYRNLGIIHLEQGQTDEACRQLTRYRESCPDSADAYKREGLCQAKLGDNELAKKSFAACQAKAPASDPIKEDCGRLLEQLQ
jgi:type IV pilus assembly protein PilF